MATIYEVAKLAGVSPATVSRVFSGAGVSPKKVEAVNKAALELDFTLNRAARSLRRKHSEVIALVIPDIENPHFTELARGVEDVAQSAGYSVVLCNSDEDFEKESNYLRIINAEKMAGVIIAAATSDPDVKPLIAQGRAIVVVDRNSDFDLDAVVIDNEATGRAATKQLLAAGYQRIACITGPREVDTAHARARGWRLVMEEKFADESLDDLLHYSSFRVDGGRAAMEKLLSLPNPPDAVVAANNLLGVGAIQVLTERGLTPPNIGVAVVGAMPHTTLTPDAVTVVSLPARHMGVTAARMLIDRISGDVEPPRTVVLRGELHPAVRHRSDGIGNGVFDADNES